MTAQEYPLNRHTLSMKTTIQSKRPASGSRKSPQGGYRLYAYEVWLSKRVAVGSIKLWFAVEVFVDRQPLVRFS
jgi:hypothetical protein